MSLIALKQLNQAQLATFIQQQSSGVAFSGNLWAYLVASGWLGPTVMYITGDQTANGYKTFTLPIGVPYMGGTGDTVARLYVDNQITSLSGVLSGQAGGGGSPNSVTTTGNEVIGGFKVFTGSPWVPSPTASSGVVNLASLTGASGAILSQMGGSVPNVVTTTGNEIIGGFKQFTGSPWVAAPNAPSGAANRFLVTGLSGFLISTITGISGVLSAGSNISGYVEGNFVHRGPINDTVSGYKTFTGAVGVGSPISTGDAVNLGYLTGVSGSIVAGAIIYTGSNTSYNFTGITGNFVNMSFYFDQNTLTTGFNQVEGFISRDFFFTGYALGTINTGTQGFFSGSLYQRTPTNSKTTFVNFSLNSGMYFSGGGGFFTTISGMNRVGVDIYLIGTGLTGFSVGVFGFGF